MKALYVGGLELVGRELVPLLEQAGYEVDCGNPDPARQYDLVVDNASTSATEIRALVAGIGQHTAHYVLISSSRVYPAFFRLRPWCEDEVDVTLDLFPSLPPDVLAARSTERELRLLSRGRFPITILRPAGVDGLNAPDGITHWFVDRILDGGLIVLPEGDLPTYRHVSSADLARAIVTVAGRNEAFDLALNVASQAVLGYWGHAAMVRDGLSVPLRYGYVPAWRWRAAGLSLPMGELASSSFIESSPVLHQLGWRPGDTFEFVTTLARQCAEHRRYSDKAVIERERHVLNETETVTLYTPAIASAPLPHHKTRQWALRGWAGRPASLTLERIDNVPSFPAPVVKVCALTLTAPEERFLRGEYPQHGERAIGHNALLQVVQPGASGLACGDMMVPLSTLPCDDTECPFCHHRNHAVLGITCNGYGFGVCTTPPSHLIPAPTELGMAALLADPLATLLAALSAPLANDQGPVWIAGRTFEAALVAWLAQDAGRQVVHVDRRPWSHPEFPVQGIGDALEQVRAGTIAAPTLAVDFTGACDVSWPLAYALTAGSSLYVRRRPLGIPHGIHWYEIPAAAPGRALLEEAMNTLQRWAIFRNLNARVGPAVPLDIYWDAWLPSPFSLPWLEDQS